VVIPYRESLISAGADHEVKPETAIEANFIQRQCQCIFGGENGIVGRVFFVSGLARCDWLQSKNAKTWLMETRRVRHVSPLSLEIQLHQSQRRLTELIGVRLLCHFGQAPLQTCSRLSAPLQMTHLESRAFYISMAEGRISLLTTSLCESARLLCPLSRRNCFHGTVIFCGEKWVPL